MAILAIEMPLGIFLQCFYERQAEIERHASADQAATDQ